MHSANRIGNTACGCHLRSLRLSIGECRRQRSIRNIGVRFTDRRHARELVRRSRGRAGCSGAREGIGSSQPRRHFRRSSLLRSGVGTRHFAIAVEHSRKTAGNVILIYSSPHSVEFYACLGAVKIGVTPFKPIRQFSIWHGSSNQSWCGRWESNPHDVAVEGF